MKCKLIVTFTFLSLILNGQSNMKEKLSELFLGLDLTSNLQNMVTNSPLKFEYGVNRTISWEKSSNNMGNYVANFDKHELIKSKIKKGLIIIASKEQNILTNDFSINERIGFYNEDDMISEYHKLTESYEKLGYRVKNSIVQNEDFETKFENTEILIEKDSKKSALTIGYYLPLKEEKVKEYFLTVVYTNY